jgi:hypothetical protein
MSICNGYAGARGYKPIGIFIHNDAGSKNANAAFYKSWLQTHDLNNGFAHFYVGNDGTLQAEDDGNIAYHCGNWPYNKDYLSIEVCQSMGDLDVFKSNEEKALQLAAQKCIQYGITPSNNTIRLHQEVYSTACPHRSVEIHGSANACKAYFIQRINEIIATTNKTVTKSSTTNTQTERKEITMVCFYRITDLNKDKVYYFDGQKVHPLNHPDERKVLNSIYKENNGKDMPEFLWTSKAPYYIRLKETMNRTSPDFFVK